MNRSNRDQKVTKGVGKQTQQANSLQNRNYKDLTLYIWNGYVFTEMYLIM